jgi:NADPH:quinone reductase-like Zn-dependent oxidoreductase
MRAVTIVDGELVWAERPDPEPGTGEIAIAVRAAGINGADLLQRRGLYPAPAGSPADIPGLEAAGEVVALGPGSTRFALGDRVMAVVGGGGQAERLVVHERSAMPVPAGMPWEHAGGLPEAFTTAHDALFTQAGLAMGERVCIHGAAGGVGTAAVQLALAAGASVVATVRNPELRDAVQGLDAHVPAMGGTSAATHASALQVVGPDGFGAHGPFDVILELVGGPNLDADVKALASDGRVTVIGVGAGAKAEINLLALMGVRGRIMASTLRARPLEGKAAAARAVERHVLPGFAGGSLHVPVAASYAMAEAAAAYERFAAGGKFGKIVLTNDR